MNSCARRARGLDP